METQNHSSNENGSSHVSVIGSSISLICFFAPWIGCEGKTFSGADIGGDTWLVFASSAISLLAYFFFKSQNTISKSKPFIAIGSLVGICVLIYKYYKFQDSEFHSSFDVKWGAIATLIGLVISVFGVAAIADEKLGEERSHQETNQFCSNCGKQYYSNLKEDFCQECGNKL